MGLHLLASVAAGLAVGRFLELRVELVILIVLVGGFFVAKESAGPPNYDRCSYCGQVKDPAGEPTPPKPTPPMNSAFDANPPAHPESRQLQRH